MNRIFITMICAVAISVLAIPESGTSQNVPSSVTTFGVNHVQSSGGAGFQLQAQTLSLVSQNRLGMETYVGFDGWVNGLDETGDFVGVLAAAVQVRTEWPTLGRRFRPYLATSVGLIYGGSPGSLACALDQSTGRCYSNSGLGLMVGAGTGTAFTISNRLEATAVFNMIGITPQWSLGGLFADVRFGLAYRLHRKGNL